MNAYLLYMIAFNRIGISEGIDFSKISASKECNICHCWYFFNYSFKFQPNICNMCYDLLIISMNFVFMYRKKALYIYQNYI